MSSHTLPQPQLVRTLLLLSAILFAFVAEADAQYLYLDTNGDGVHSATDVIAPSGSTIADVWIRTDHNRDGGEATCITEDGELSIAGYEFVLGATNGTIHWSQFENAIPQFFALAQPATTDVEFHVGYSGEFLAPGTYRLARLTIDVVSGTPSIFFAPSGESDRSWLTGFVSRCSGLEFDNTLKLGLDWQDFDGILYGGEVKHPPRIVPIETLLVAEGAVSDVAVAGTDEDGDPLLFYLRAAPVFVTLTTPSPGAGTATGNLHLAPAYDASGIYGFDLGVTDGVFRDSSRVRLEVLETNRPPHLGRWPYDYFIEAGQLSIDFLALSDPDVGQQVQAFVVSGPRFMRVEQNYPDLAILRLTPTVLDVGVTSGTVGLTDGYLTVTDTFAITVYALPQISPIQDMSVAVGQTATQDFTATDPDGGTMTTALVSGPPYISASALESTPGIFRGQIRLSPQMFDVGDATAVIAVREEEGESRTGLHIHVFDPTGQAGGARPLLMSTFLGFGLPKEPRAIGWGDFDNDGVLDAAAICVGDYDSDGFGQPIQILTGRRDGTFVSGATIPDVFGARDITVADLDGDEHADILVSGGGFLRSFPGNGDGTFEPGNDLALGFNFGGVRTADFNEDTRLDMVATSISQADSRTLVFLNDGSGGFAVRLDLPGSGPYPLALSVGDLNGDAHADVIVEDAADGGLDYWLGNGDGTFSAPRAILDYGVGARYELADLDSDGDLDLALPDIATASLRLLENRGAEGFVERAPLIPEGGVDGCALGDLDSDGRLDLVTGRTGSGILSAFAASGPFTFAPAGRVRSAYSALALSLRDANFDGRLDILALDYVGEQVIVHLQGSGGGFEEITAVSTLAAPAWIVGGDWNQDRLADAAVGSHGSGEIEFFAAENGTLRSTEVMTLPGEPSRVRAADLDGDHVPEVIAVVPTERSLFVLRPGGRTPAISTVPWTQSMNDFDVADWNGDGRLDLVVTSGLGSSDSTAVLAGAPDGTFHEIARIRGHGRRIAVGDYNGDGFRDIAMVMGAAGYPITVAWGRAGGVLEAPYFYVGPDREINDLTTVGQDRSGRDGLGILSADAKTIALYRGEGDADFMLQGTLRAGVAPTAPVVGDVNGDGAADLVIANAGGYTFSIFPGEADGSPGSRQDFGAGPGSVGAAIGDVDGDGRLDVLVANELDHTISIHRNLGTARVNHAPIARAGGPYTGVTGTPIDFDGTASSDGDGDPIAYLWSFGDGVDGVGARATHRYASSGTYRVRLVVNDGLLSASDSTTADVPAVLGGRVFRAKGSAPIVIGVGPPNSCISIEPLAGNFSVADIDPESIWLIASGSGTADSIRAVEGKGTVIGDTDRNGIQDRSACFARERLENLFTGFTGRVSVPIHLRCRLFSGAMVDGTGSLLILARGGGLASLVKPQPAVHGGVIGFRLDTQTTAAVHLFDARGRLVRTLLMKGQLSAGYHEVPFDTPTDGAARLPSGVYFYRIETSGVSETGRILIAR